MDKKTVLLPLLIFALVQLACNAPAGGMSTPDTFATLNGLYTESALTARAGSPLPPSATPNMQFPTLTQIAPPATNTYLPSLTIPAPKCDAAEFVGDVTYADGSIVTRGAAFVKIWRIKNAGTCSWTTSYALVFAGGDLMNGPLVVALAKNVNPGETVDLQASFTAPNKDGNYRSYWKLRNAAGALFGVGTQAETAFWADVKVIGKSYVAYEFVPNYCAADWSNASAALPCPGALGAAGGFVVKLNAPVMENGRTEDEPALLVSPQDVRDGIISGQYPAFTVQTGDRFRALIGCQYDADKCNVVFRLDYKNNGKIKTLGTWYEVYEGSYYSIDLDLSELAGRTVKFILFAGANGGNSEDEALWVNPHIARQGVPPPPTATFTPSPTFTLPPPTPTFTATNPTLTATPITPTLTPVTSTETPTP